jgi:beta-1,4-mannosyl-glycoprotein beta-1,4-N-acetylglucosaminyltransferase
MIVDTFMFYNELDILEKRLKLLDNVVDKFVLVESEETHVGNPKPLFFQENRERYSKWLDKITHVVVKKSELSFETDKYSLEKHQRHEIVKGLEDIPDDAIVMISDVDELPDPDIVKIVKPDVAFHMFMFEYSFDYMFTGELWVGTVLTNAKRVRQFGPNYFRYHRWSFPVIRQAGWHCSSFGDSKHVFNKIQNYLHASDDKHQGQTLEDFEKYVKNGIHSDGMTKLIRTPDELISRVKLL